MQNNKIKTLAHMEYPTQESGFGYIPMSAIGKVLALAISKGETELYMTDAEFTDFLYLYDQLLPWDWDGKKFRGMNINRVKSN